MKRLVFLLILIFVLIPAHAEVIHDISVSQETLKINSTLILQSDEILDYWEVSLSMPSDSEIIKIKDSVGIIEDYEFVGDELSFKTNSKRSKTKIVNIIYSVPVKEKYGFKSSSLGLFGFGNETTTILAPNFSYFFVPNAEIQYGEEIKAKGKGPLNAKILFGGEKESEHFFTNSELNLSELENYYWILEGLTGIEPPTKFGIAVLSEEEYEGDLEKWSAGIFTGGLIVVREDLKDKKKMKTLMHETAHGFNSFVLDWDNTKISWFDEGIATCTGSIISRLLNQTTPELFGEEIRWREKNKIYYLEPYQKPEDLLNYYKEGKHWMLNWYPKKYADERREFGYAYSELFIRGYLKDNPKGLHPVYEQLIEIDERVKNEDKRNQILLNILNEDFKPCYFSNLEGIKNCTKELNEMTFEIPKGKGKKLNYQVEAPEVPEVDEQDYVDIGNISNETNSFLQNIQNFFNFIISGLQSLFNQFNNL